MTRFGVMKHLKQLEEAGLVVTKRRGREKLHFLNPVPIRLVHDRWVSKYAEPWAAALSDLKHRLESPMEKVFEIYIRTTPERLWEAITDPRDPEQVPLRRARRLGLDAGLALRDERTRRAGLLGEGENLEVDPPRRLVQTHDRAVGRRREERGHLARHLGDRAGRRLVPPDSSPTTSCARARTTSSTAAGR